MVRDLWESEKLVNTGNIPKLNESRRRFIQSGVQFTDVKAEGLHRAFAHPCTEEIAQPCTEEIAQPCTEEIAQPCTRDLAQKRLCQCAHLSTVHIASCPIPSLQMDNIMLVILKTHVELVCDNVVIGSPWVSGATMKIPTLIILTHEANAMYLTIP